MQKIEQIGLERGMAITASVRSQCCHGLPPELAVRASLRASTLSWGLILRGLPVLLIGVAADGYLSNRAEIWGLVSKEVEQHKVAAGRFSRRAIEVALKHYDILEATVQFGYDLGDKWVRWLGFSEVGVPVFGLRHYVLEKK